MLLFCNLHYYNILALYIFSLAYKNDRKTIHQPKIYLSFLLFFYLSCIPSFNFFLSVLHLILLYLSCIQFLNNMQNGMQVMVCRLWYAKVPLCIMYVFSWCRLVQMRTSAHHGFCITYSRLLFISKFTVS